MTRDAESPLPNRGKKILLTALVLGSLFGISTVAAMAETVTVTVVVTDSTPPGCQPNITNPTWSPSQSVDYGFGLDNSADLYESDINYRESVPFSVTLGLLPGSDSENCDPSADYRPSGTVTSSFTSNQGLVTSSLECSMSPFCNARILYTDNDIDGGTVAGTVAVPSSVGTFAGTLTLTWTP